MPLIKHTHTHIYTYLLQTYSRGSGALRQTLGLSELDMVGTTRALVYPAPTDSLSQYLVRDLYVSMYACVQVCLKSEMNKKTGENTQDLIKKARIKKVYSVCSHLERHNTSDGLAVGSKHFVELACLLQSPRESIQNEAVLALIALDSILDDTNDDVVRHKPIHAHARVICTRHKKKKNISRDLAMAGTSLRHDTWNHNILYINVGFWTISKAGFTEGLRFTRRSPSQLLLAFQQLCLQQQQHGAYLLSKVGGCQAFPRSLVRACLCLLMHDGIKFSRDACKSQAQRNY